MGSKEPNFSKTFDNIDSPTIDGQHRSKKKWKLNKFTDKPWLKYKIRPASELK